MGNHAPPETSEENHDDDLQHHMTQHDLRSTMAKKDESTAKNEKGKKPEEPTEDSKGEEPNSAQNGSNSVVILPAKKGGPKLKTD